jgi:hypothetical protein
MSTFEQARQQALAQVQETNGCRILTKGEVAKRKLKAFAEVWLLDTEIFQPDGNVQPLQLLIALPEDFPLVLPTLYLEKADYERIRYIPHVDTSGLICTYDSETVRVNPADPYGIVRECVLQARRLIEQGLAGSNSEDFEEEFIAYWTNSYSDQDKLGTGVSLAATPIQVGPCSLLSLNKSFGGYQLVLPAEEPVMEPFKQLLKRHGIGIEKFPAFHLGELGEPRPPYGLNNGEALALVGHHFPEQWEAFLRFLRGVTEAPLVLFHRNIAGQTLYFGWQHSFPEVVRKGFRPGKISPVESLTTFNRAKPLLRWSFDTLTTQRLLQRTAGEQPRHEYTLLLAGLGSIGSNLLHYLASLPLKEMRLVDAEVLSLENINRHLLGIDFVDSGKAEALQRHLELQQPLRPVSHRKDSIVQVAQREPAYLDECDAVILAVGRSTVEEHLLKMQAAGALTRPIFILWVEPYLAGGHLLYFPAGHATDYNSLFEEGYYKYNVLATAEYRKPTNQMLLKEAGCQGSYIPYSQEYVNLFLGRIFPELRRLLRQPEGGACAFTWLGNYEAISQQELARSAFASKLAEGDLIKTNL